MADRALMDAVVQVSFAVTAHLTRIGAANDLSLTQLRLLGILWDREPRMTELADHLGLDRSSISGLIDRATERGLVARVPDPSDGRSSRVTLTDDGRALAVVVGDAVADQVEALTSGLDEQQRGQLRVLLEGLLVSGQPT